MGYLTAPQRSVSSSVADALNARAISTPRGGQRYAKSVSNLLARVFHLIRQPVALLFLSALSKSLLLVGINSRQLTNSMLVFTPGGILSEYEFRSRSDHRYCRLLRAHRERPRSRCAEQGG
jgi:hypothetical protein